MEEERLRIRRELIQKARRQKGSSIRNGKRHEQDTVAKQLFLFRSYVTMVIVGIAIVLSFFHTEATNMVIENLKEAIAYEMPLEDIQQWKEKAVSVFQQTIQKKDINTIQEPQQTIQETKTKGFQPDLNEKSGEIP